MHARTHARHVNYLDDIYSTTVVHTVFLYFHK